MGAPQRTKAHHLVPDERLGLFTGNSAFFRSGRPGQWSEVLDSADLAADNSLIRSLASPDFVDWVENGAAARVPRTLNGAYDT